MTFLRASAVNGTCKCQVAKAFVKIINRTIASCKLVCEPIKIILFGPSPALVKLGVEGALGVSPHEL